MKNSCRKQRRYFFSLGCALGVVLIPQKASSFDMSSSLVAGGGGSSAGGNFTVAASIAQPVAGTGRSGSGQQSMQVGFWFTGSVLLKILSISRLTNGHILVACMGVPNIVNDLQASPDLNSGNFVPTTPAPPVADGSGLFQYDDAAAVSLTKRFYRLTYP